MSDKPEFCPFCGGTLHLGKQLRDGCEAGEPDAWAYWLQCDLCAASGGPWAKKPFDAFYDWKTRTPSNTASTGQERDSAHEPGLSNSADVPAQGA